MKLGSASVGFGGCVPYIGKPSFHYELNFKIMSCVIIITAGGEIPFHVIGRKYTEGTNSRTHAYSTPNVRVHRG